MGEEGGFALASAVMIMLLVMLVTAVGALAVVRSFDETRRDRSSTSALSAADAAIDVLVWRMNKQLTASEIHNVTGLTQTLVSERGCAEINATNIVHLGLSATSCDHRLLLDRERGLPARPGVRDRPARASPNPARTNKNAPQAGRFWGTGRRVCVFGRVTGVAASH